MDEKILTAMIKLSNENTEYLKCKKCRKTFSHPKDVLFGFGADILCRECR